MSPLFNSFRAARAPLRVLSPIRTYVPVGGRSHTIPRPSSANKTPQVAQVSTTQPNSTQGNPEIVDGYPTTASEIEADVATQSEIVNSTPPESIPSSGALALPPLLDTPPTGGTTDWSRSYHGLSTQPFPVEVSDILQAAIEPLDIEIKPGLSFLSGYIVPGSSADETSTSRWHDLSPRNKISQNIEQGLRSRWLGPGSS